MEINFNPKIIESLESKWYGSFIVSVMPSRNNEYAKTGKVYIHPNNVCNSFDGFLYFDMGMNYNKINTEYVLKVECVADDTVNIDCVEMNKVTRLALQQREGRTIRVFHKKKDDIKSSMKNPIEII